MAVTSKPLRDAKDSAVVSRATLRRQRGAVERFTALLILFVSFIGTIVALYGGWTPFIASLMTLTPRWYAILGGFGIQLLLTFLEWHYYDRRLISWPARVVDTAFTALGYGPLVVESLSAALAAAGVPYAGIVAWCIITIISFLTAWFPESRLVE